MRTYDLTQLVAKEDRANVQPGSPAAMELARLAIGARSLTAKSEAPKIRDTNNMSTDELALALEEIHEEEDRSLNGIIRSLSMLRGSCRRHLDAHDSAGPLAAALGIANPISSMIHGANLPATELDYMVAMLELASKKLRAGQRLDRDGLSHP